MTCGVSERGAARSRPRLLEREKGFYEVSGSGGQTILERHLRERAI